MRAAFTTKRHAALFATSCKLLKLFRMTLCELKTLRIHDARHTKCRATEYLAISAVAHTNSACIDRRFVLNTSAKTGA